MSKKLSFIFSCKNDDYVKDFVKRMEYSVNYNLKIIEEIGKLDQIEFIIVDWGSEIEISENFKVFDKKFVDKIKFYYFNTKITKNSARDLPGNFWQELTHNCGIVRSKGSHIITGHHDVIFSYSSWINIFRVIEDERYDNNIFWLPRIELNNIFLRKHLDFNNFRNYLDRIFLSKLRISHANMQHGGGASGFLVKKNIFQEKFGISENLKSKGRYSGSDADLWQKASIDHDHQDGLSEGIISYKFPIHSNKSKKNAMDLREFFKGKIRIKNFRYNLDYNNQAYGLNNLDVKYKNPKVISKDISIAETSQNFDYKDNFKNIFFLSARSYFHTLLDKINFKEFLVTRDIYKYLNLSNCLCYLSIGLPKINRIAVISKNCSYLDIRLFIHHTKKNNKQASDDLQKINRYFNRVHEGYYRFILDNNFDNILTKIKELDYKNKIFAEIYADKFDKKDFENIILEVIKNFEKFNIVKINNYNIIASEFYKEFSEVSRGIFIRKSELENFKKFENIFSKKDAFNQNIYVAISFIAIMVSYLNKLKFTFFYFFKSIYRMLKK